MSIIGYDCEQRPLHPSDQCVIIAIINEEFARETGLSQGDVVRVVESDPVHPNSAVIDTPVKSYAYASVDCRYVRKLPDDQHDTSDQSFSELMHGLGCSDEVPA